MATTFFFFLHVVHQLGMSVSSTPVGLEEADSFVSVLEVPCKSTKPSAFVSVEIGGEGGERIVVGRIEEGAAACSSAPSPPSVSGIDQPPPASAADVGCAGGHDDGGKREGPGGGGNDPGGGDGGSGGGDVLGSGGRSGGDEENLGFDKEWREELNKLGKISIVITAQTATSLVSFPKDASTMQKYVLYTAVGMDICAYIFCFVAVLLRRKKPLEASIMTLIGISCSGFGFLLTMCLIVPPNFFWVVAVASIVLLSSVSILFVSCK